MAEDGSLQEIDLDVTRIKQDVATLKRLAAECGEWASMDEIADCIQTDALREIIVWVHEVGRSNGHHEGLEYAAKRSGRM